MNVQKLFPKDLSTEAEQFICSQEVKDGDIGILYMHPEGLLSDDVGIVSLQQEKVE